VQLPGREARLAEPPDIDVAALARAIVARASGRPFALFGHSMGARLAFEAARQMRRDGAPGPVRLFASGCRPPHLDVPLTRLAGLPDDELCARIVAMGGTPPAALAHPELRELVLPAIRSDFAMVEAYRYRLEPPLDVPIVVLAGADDPEAAAAEMTGWSAHTAAWTRLYTLPGDHFFLHSAQADVLGRIAAETPDQGGPEAPGAARQLAGDEVYLLEARLDGRPDLCAAAGELSPHERRRAADLGDARASGRFVGRHALRRRVLRALGVEVGTAEYARGPGGRPAVVHPSGLRFCAAHAGGVALFAAALGRDVGVDVRRRGLDAGSPAVARHLGAEERADLAGLAEEDADDETLRLLAAKHAVLRAAGAGLDLPPQLVTFADRPTGAWRVAGGPGAEHLTGWRVRHLDLPGAVAALAVGAGAWRLRFESLRGPGDTATVGAR
jgi:surfactin synthase thioesterase subunit/phosphopantetheinyl transferase